MERIFNKQTGLYFVIAMAAAVLIGLIFFTWRGSKSLNQTDQASVESNKVAPEKHVSITSHEKPLRPSRTRDIKQTAKRRPPGQRNNTQRVRMQDTQIQVDAQRVLANRIKYEGLFEKAKDLEVNDEDIIQTGE